MRRSTAGVLGLLAVLLLLGGFQKVPCLDGKVDTAALTDRQCYSDIPQFYAGRGLAADAGWFGGRASAYPPLEYPPVTALFIEASARVTHLIHGVDDGALRARAATDPALLAEDPDVRREERTFYAVSAVGLGLVGLLAGALLLRLPGRARRPWLSLLLVAPVLVLDAYVNWDLLAVATVVLAIFAWHRRSLWLFGVLVGIGTATKLFPLLLLGGALAILLGQSRYRPAAVVTASTVGAWVLVNAPLFVADRGDWLAFWTYHAERAPSFGSSWFALRILGREVDAEVITVVYVSSLVLAWALLVLATRTGRLRPDLEGYTLVLLTVFVLGGVVVSPQFALWFLPFVLLRVGSAWLLGLWSAAQVFHYVETWFFIRGVTTPEVGIDKVYLSSVAVRVLVEVAVATTVLVHLARTRPRPPLAVPRSPAEAGA